MMPIAMLLGVILHEYLNILAFLTPYLIAIMLLITYCNISFKEIRFTKLHFWLILIQVIGAVVFYYLLYPIHPIIAQAAMICIFAPTATSAPVITGMLGGNVASLTAFSLLSNMIIVIVAPILFALAGEISTISFSHSVWIVFQKVFLLLFLPFFGALLLRKYFPRIRHEIQKAKSLSFYLWSFALIIITGKTVQFILDQESPDYRIEISIAIIALIICVSQFLLGRKLGSICNDTIAGGQGLGQKNTILAIWMAQTYLNPISSIGPGAYVLWQNIVNSYQVWRNRKNI